LAETAKLRTASRAGFLQGFPPFPPLVFRSHPKGALHPGGYSQPRMIFSAGFAAIFSDYMVVTLKYLSSHTFARGQHFEFLRAMLRRNSCRTADLQVPSMSGSGPPGLFSIKSPAGCRATSLTLSLAFRRFQRAVIHVAALSIGGHAERALPDDAVPSSGVRQGTFPLSPIPTVNVLNCSS
jgi:hypothetical protein